MSRRKKYLQSIDKLLDIMDELRVKCPWDRKQTIKSLRSLTIEETYELSESNSPEACIKKAVEKASDSVTKKGTQSSYS